MQLARKARAAALLPPLPSWGIRTSIEPGSCTGEHSSENDYTPGHWKLEINTRQLQRYTANYYQEALGKQRFGAGVRAPLHQQPEAHSDRILQHAPLKSQGGVPGTVCSRADQNTHHTYRAMGEETQPFILGMGLRPSHPDKYASSTSHEQEIPVALVL